MRDGAAPAKTITIRPARLKAWLRVLVTPSVWLPAGYYDAEWDQMLLGLLEEYEWVRISQYRARLGDREVWVANHPYASMGSCAGPMAWWQGQSGRPSRATILYAGDRLREVDGG